MEEFESAQELADGGALSAHWDEQQRRGDATGDEYPLWNGPGFRSWEELWERLRALGGALIVWELLSPSAQQALEMPGYLAGTPWESMEAV